MGEYGRARDSEMMIPWNHGAASMFDRSLFSRVKCVLKQRETSSICFTDCHWLLLWGLRLFAVKRFQNPRTPEKDMGKEYQQWRPFVMWRSLPPSRSIQAEAQSGIYTSHI